MKGKRKLKLSERRKIQLMFTAGVAIVLVVTEIIITVVEFVLTKTGVISADKIVGSNIFTFLMWSIASLSLGFSMAMLVSRFIMKPISKVVDGLTRLSHGEFSTRINFVEGSSMEKIYRSFNNLASELEKTQILRSDFVNNFSHEFKTPINSINGLISLMKKGNLPPSKQQEYLDIIADETHRLAVITTNILNLSKYESHGVLTEQTKFNLSEQIRTCVLLQEKAWSTKKLKLGVDFEEHYLYGNEEMLYQVWVNLLDNAVKFSTVGGELNVRITDDDRSIDIEIENEGIAISPDDEEKIFQKFYRTMQADNHGGNGIGLSIVKQIIQLHGGRVWAKSENGKTTFTVKLPKNDYSNPMAQQSKV